MNTPQQPSFALMMSHWRWWLAFGFGTGLSKVAPGTMGSVFGLMLFAGLMLISPLGVVMILIAGLWFGEKICDYANERLEGEDHSSIVLDEILAVGWVVLLLPAQTLEWWLIGLVLFRWFDITKPLLIKHIERQYSNGRGIMLDDYVAAAYTLGFVWLIAWLI